MSPSFLARNCQTRITRKRAFYITNRDGAALRNDGKFLYGKNPAFESLYQDYYDETGDPQTAQKYAQEYAAQLKLPEKLPVAFNMEDNEFYRTRHYSQAMYRLQSLPKTVKCQIEEAFIARTTQAKPVVPVTYNDFMYRAGCAFIKAGPVMVKYVSMFATLAKRN